MRSSRFRRGILAGALVAATAVAFTQLTATSESDVGPRAPTAPLAATVPHEVAEHLAVFRRAPTPRDLAPPDRVYGAPEGLPGAPAPPPDIRPYGGNLRLSRRVQDAPEGAVYLVAGRTGVCFTSQSGIEEGCQPLENVVAGDNAQAVICSPYLHPDVRAVYGILPDGAHDAAVAFADGTRAPLAVVGNTYLIRTRVPEPLPTTIVWSDAAGVRHEVGSSMPADANESRCHRPGDDLLKASEATAEQIEEMVRAAADNP